MVNGNNTYPGRDLSPFYMTCLGERTQTVGICRFGVYDPTLRACTTELDPGNQFDILSCYDGLYIPPVNLRLVINCCCQLAPTIKYKNRSVATKVAKYSCTLVQVEQCLV